MKPNNYEGEILLNKKIKRLIIIAVIIILILIIAFKVVKVQNIIMHNIYPIKYSEYVYKYSEENRVDPLLVFAIIKAESNFDDDVVSNRNAIGLMQLVDATANDMARRLKIDYNDKTLYQPEQNIMLGVKYFSVLYEKYGNIPVALIAYNAGMGTVDKWIENGTINKDGSNIENVPYTQTNNYVRKILRDYEIYKDLYN